MYSAATIFCVLTLGMCWSHDSAESKVVAFHSEYEDYSIESDDSSSLSFYRPFYEHRKLKGSRGSSRSYSSYNGGDGNNGDEEPICEPECDVGDYVMFSVFGLLGLFICVIIGYVTYLMVKSKGEEIERNKM